MKRVAMICAALGMAALAGGEAMAHHAPPPARTARHLPPGMVWCSRCDGTGRTPSGFMGWKTKRCPDCDGTGMRAIRRSKYDMPPRRAPLSPAEMGWRQNPPPPPKYNPPPKRHDPWAGKVKQTPPPKQARPSGAQRGGWHGGKPVAPARPLPQGMGGGRPSGAQPGGYRGGAKNPPPKR